MLERYGEIKNQDIQLVDCGDKDIEDDEQGYLKLMKLEN